MSSLNNRIARMIVEEHVDRMYKICGKWVPKLLVERGRYLDRQQIEELVQDAVCRAFDSFLKRCQKRLPQVADRRKWIGQNAFFASKTVVCGGLRRSFGTARPTNGYLDAMDRRGSVRRIGLHGTDEERQLVAKEEQHQPTTEELLECLEKQGMPDDLKTVAKIMLFGFGRHEIAELLRFSVSRADQKIRAVRDWLLAKDVRPNAYAVVVDALRACA